MSPSQVSGLLTVLPQAIRGIAPGAGYGSGVIHWCMERVAGAAAEWLSSGTAGSRGTGGPDEAARQPLTGPIPDFSVVFTKSPPGADPPPGSDGARLVSLACSLPLLSDWARVPDVTNLVEGVIAAAAPGQARAAVLQHLHDLLLRCLSTTLLLVQGPAVAKPVPPSPPPSPAPSPPTYRSGLMTTRARPSCSQASASLPSTLTRSLPPHLSLRSDDYARKAQL